MQVAFEREVVQVEQLAQLLREALGVLEVLDAQRAARDLVLVGRADALAGRADLAGAARFAQRLARLVDRDVERQDQRARLADEETRADVDADRLQPLDLAEQVHRIDDDAVADVAGHAVAHDARRDQLQRRLDAVDHQRVAGVVAALEAHHRLRVVGQPVDDLALAFVAPLGADDDDVAAGRTGVLLLHVIFESGNVEGGASEGAHRPVAVDRDELAVAGELFALVAVPGQHADDDLALLAQAPDRRAQRRRLGPWRADRRPCTGAGHQRRDLLQVQAEADGRAVPAEYRADLVVAAAARDGIAGALGIDREARPAVVRVAADVGEVVADRRLGVGDA